MTTTSMFTGLDPEGRSSSRVLRPPGGGSSFVFGASDNKAQPARRHKMASNIFGIPDKDPLPAPPAQEIGAPAGTLCGDSVDSAAERTCPPEDCSDNAEYMVEAAEASEPVESVKEASQAAGEPSEPTPSAPSYGRRNPPGGKSSLILG